MDQWIIRRCQVLYDYLWDRWGIQIGTATAATYIVWGSAMLPFVEGGLFAIGCVVLFIGFGIAGFRNTQQSNGNFLRLNIVAEATIEDWFPWAMRCVFLPVNLIADFFMKLDLHYYVADAALIAVMYGFCIKVRERDESRFRKLAPASNPAS